MINKGSYMYMYLFLLHKNNIRSIHVILNPTDLRQGITMAGSTFWSIGWVMMTLICTLCQWQWCNRSCADLECEGGGGSPLHSFHSRVTKNRHGTFLIPTLGIQNLIFIFRTPSGILLDPRMIFMDLASVWDEAWLSLPELWMFSSRIPDSWDFREVRRFESSWWDWVLRRESRFLQIFVQCNFGDQIQRAGTQRDGSVLFHCPKHQTPAKTSPGWIDRDTCRIGSLYWCYLTQSVLVSFSEFCILICYNLCQKYGRFQHW